MNQEPVVAGYTVTALVTIVVNMLVVFDVWDPTAEQIAAITSCVVAVSSVIAAFLVRARVRPAATSVSLPLPPPPPPPES